MSVSRVAVLCALAGVSACAIGETGVAPPNDRIFFPSGVLVDPVSSRWLYVVNSNADLRYNAGTLTALDLDRVRADRAAKWTTCPWTRFDPKAEQPSHFCCRDAFDARVLTCNDRHYVDSQATVRIGSFAGALLAQTFVRGTNMVRRLFVAVRADPSITFVDVTESAGRINLRCTGERSGTDVPGGPNPQCQDSWRIRQTGPKASPVVLPQEPFALALDEKLHILYVGHLFNDGVSTIDVCAPEGAEGPRLASLNPRVFPRSRFQGVTSLTVSSPGQADQPIFATPRFSFEIAELGLPAGTAATCPAPPAARDLTLVARDVVPSSAFQASGSGLPRGVDVRGVLFSTDGEKAYVLHHNSNDSQGGLHPSALVVLDRRRDADGQPSNQAVASVEVCAGPTAMHIHDTGRGPRIFVTCYEAGQIYVVDPELPAVTALIDVGRGPGTLAFSPDDPTLAYVSSFPDASVAVLDLAPGSATEYRVIQRIGFPSPSVKR